MLDQLQDAVPCPDALPEIRGREPLPRRRVAGAAVSSLVERQEASLRSLKMRGLIDQVWVHGEVGQAPAEGEQRLLGITVEAILPDGVLYSLSGQRVLQLGGEDRQAVQEEHQVQAFLVLLAVLELTNDREEVRLIEFLQCFVQAACGPEGSEPERAAIRFDTLPQNFQ